MKTVAIFGPKNLKPASFNSQIDILFPYISDPNIILILSDEKGASSLTIKYLLKIKFQNFIVYTKKSRVQNYSTRNGFSSYIEIEETLKQDSDHKIYFK